MACRTSSLSSLFDWSYLPSSFHNLLNMQHSRSSNAVAHAIDPATGTWTCSQKLYHVPVPHLRADAPLPAPSTPFRRPVHVPIIPKCQTTFDWEVNHLQRSDMLILLGEIWIKGGIWALFPDYRYYSFDESVIREILGKKLNSRTRKDLDEVHEKTGVKLPSCRRQVPSHSIALSTIFYTCFLSNLDACIHSNYVFLYRLVTSSTISNESWKKSRMQRAGLWFRTLSISFYCHTNLQGWWPMYSSSLRVVVEYLTC